MKNGLEIIYSSDSLVNRSFDWSIHAAKFLSVTGIMMLNKVVSTAKAAPKTNNNIGVLSGNWKTYYAKLSLKLNLEEYPPNMHREEIGPKKEDSLTLSEFKFIYSTIEVYMSMAQFTMKSSIIYPEILYPEFLQELSTLITSGEVLFEMWEPTKDKLAGPVKSILDRILRGLVSSFRDDELSLDRIIRKIGTDFSCDSDCDSCILSEIFKDKPCEASGVSLKKLLANNKLNLPSKDN